MTIPLGTNVGGFTLLEQLGVGGQATVYRATDGRQQVALKVLHVEHTPYSQEMQLPRFYRELDALMQLTHPNIVRLLAHGEWNGQPYAAFEYIDGEDLSVMLHRQRQLPENVALHILRQLLSALDAAHRRGLIHRDIKPDNIRVAGPHMLVKVLDFGIARTDDTARALTKTGELVGTPRYMSPEQLHGHPLTPASDVYAAGLVMVEMVCGTHALPGGSIGEQMVRLLPEHRFFQPGTMSRAVEPVIVRMLDPDPTRRFPNAAAVLAALDRPSVSREFPAADRSGIQPTVEPSNGVNLRVLQIAAAALVALCVVAALALGRVTAADDTPVAPPVAEKRNNPLTPTPPEALVALPTKTVELDTTPEFSCLARDEIAPVAKYAGYEVNVVLPDSYDGTTRLPAVFVFNNYTDTAANQLLQRTTLSRFAEHGYIVVAPHHNATFGAAWFQAHGVDAVLDALQHELCIDEDRIYAIGDGNGGQPVEEQRCDRFRAVAVVDYRRTTGGKFGLIGEFAQKVPPACATAVPYLYIASLSSCNWPVEGGNGCNTYIVRASLASHIADWQRLNVCDLGESPRKRKQYGLTCERWSCEADFEQCTTKASDVWAWHQPRGSQPDPTSKILEFFTQYAPSDADKRSD